MSKPGWLVCGLALLAPWATVGAQNLGDSAQAERERIARERSTVLQQQAQEEAQCQQRFAIEDCLRAVRRSARERLTRLRQQEERLDEAQRQERAQRRLQASEQRLRERASQVPVPAASEAPARQPKAAPALALNPQVHAQRQRQAQAEKAQRSAALKDEAATNRQERLEKEETARRRKAQRDARTAEEAARGRAPAAALPAASVPQ